jgi:hypothetical protein
MPIPFLDAMMVASRVTSLNAINTLNKEVGGVLELTYSRGVMTFGAVLNLANRVAVLTVGS